MISADRFKSPIIIPLNETRIKVRYGPFDDPRINDFISLGMSRYDDRVSIQWAGEYFENEFQGYTLELFGVEPDDEPHERHPPDFLNKIGVTTPHRVVYQQISPLQKVTGGFCVWACRVYRPDGRVVAEEIWNPQSGWVRMTNNIGIEDSEIANQLIRSIEYKPPSLTIALPVLPDDTILGYGQRWKEYLSYGYRVFSEELLRPGIALIVSRDLSKIIVIGDDTSSPPYEYNEEERVVYFDLRGKGDGTWLICPACQQSYVIAPDGSWQVTEGTINIDKGTRLFHCACGVLLAFHDRYEFLSLPFRLTDFAPLFLVGMSRTADLFVRYVLSPDGHTLVEEVGVVTQHTPQAISLTDIPGFRFANWCSPPDPSFVSDSHCAYDVRLWRIRTYHLGAETFEEKTRRSFQGGWEKVVRTVRELPDNFANERLESLLAANKNQLPQQVDIQTKKARGGDTRAPEIRRLWAGDDDLKGFARMVNELLPHWKWIKTNVYSSALTSSNQQQEWVSEMWKRDETKLFAAKYAQFTKELLRRAVDSNLNKTTREPVELACYHAALEFKVSVNGERLSIIDAHKKYASKPPEPSTLRDKYKTGVALLEHPE